MRQWLTDFWTLCHMNKRMHPAASWNRPGNWALMSLKWGNLTHNGAHCPQPVYRKRCTREGGAGGLAGQSGPAQWAEYGARV